MKRTIIFISLLCILVGLWIYRDIYAPPDHKIQTILKQVQSGQEVNSLSSKQAAQLRDLFTIPVKKYDRKPLIHMHPEKIGDVYRMRIHFVFPFYSNDHSDVTKTLSGGAVFLLRKKGLDYEIESVKIDPYVMRECCGPNTDVIEDWEQTISFANTQKITPFQRN